MIKVKTDYSMIFEVEFDFVSTVTEQDLANNKGFVPEEVIQEFEYVIEQMKEHNRELKK